MILPLKKRIRQADEYISTIARYNQDISKIRSDIDANYQHLMAEKRQLKAVRAEVEHYKSINKTKDDTIA